MTARPHRPPAPAPVRVGLALHCGTVRTGWCTTCKAWTQLTADLLLLAPDGVSHLGTWTWCEICDDADAPLPPRRIPRA